MKTTVGYITSWRRMIFWTLVFSIILFGLASTLCTTYIGPGLVSNIISVGVLVICIGIFILVIGDKWNKFTGEGFAAISDEVLVYNDKKRHFNIKLSDIKKIDIENIKTGSQSKTVLAYRIVIKTSNKKYYIESDRALGRQMTEMDLYNLYLFLMEKRG